MKTLKVIAVSLTLVVMGFSVSHASGDVKDNVIMDASSDAVIAMLPVDLEPPPRS